MPSFGRRTQNLKYAVAVVPQYVGERATLGARDRHARGAAILRPPLGALLAMAFELRTYIGRGAAAARRTVLGQRYIPPAGALLTTCMPHTSCPVILQTAFPRAQPRTCPSSWAATATSA